MKIHKLIIIALVLFLLPAYAYSSTLSSLHISLIQGDVQVKTEDAPEWVPASINMPLMEGDRVGYLNQAGLNSSQDMVHT